MLQPLESLVRSEWEHPKWERHWEKKKKVRLEQCLEANIPLRMNSGGSFEIAAGIKSILFSPHERTMEVIGGEREHVPFFHYNLWEQETEQSRLALLQSYLTEVTRASLTRCQHRKMKKERAWTPRTGTDAWKKTKNADYCGFSGNISLQLQYKEFAKPC